MSSMVQDRLSSERITLPPELKKKHRGAVTAGVVVLLAVLIAQLAISVSRESLSWDEGDHIFAGYMSLTRADFGLNPEHPPLAKLLAAVPLVPMHLKVPELQNRFFKLEAYFSGRDFIFANDAEKVTFRARMGVAVLAVLLGLFVFLAAREMFGTLAAFIALTLVVFEPTLIAHGAMVATDTGLTCFIVATIYAFYRYVKAPSVGRMIVVGLAGGLAAVTKHSAVLLLPMVALLAISEVIRGTSVSEKGSAPTSESRAKQSLRLGLSLFAATVVAAVVIWAFYGFRYAARPNGMQVNPPLTEAVTPLKPLEARGILALANWHLLPESYLYGFADIRAMANYMPSYIFGKVYAHGVWFYFPVVFVIKSTLALLLLLLIAIAAIATGKLRAWREILFLTIPPGVYLLVTMGSKLNIGARHILVLFVFTALLAAGAAAALIRLDRRWLYPIGALVLFHMVSCLRMFPTSYMAYANELWGGPSQTYKYLTDSNTDWGQQLLATKKYLDQRGVKNCWFAYFPYSAIRPADYGIPCRPLPNPDSGWFGDQIDTPPVIEGPVLISAGDLTWFEGGSNVLNPYRDFQKLRPTTVIEYGVFVFDGTFSVPMASALGHVSRARTLLDRKQVDEALVEAQSAVALAPDALQTQMVAGDVLTAMHRSDEARQAYERAMAIARTMEPSAQETWVPRVQRNLAAQ